MQVTGACHCGQIRFSAEVDESKVIICHCTDCQVMASSAFRVGAIILRESFHLEGQTKEYCKIVTSGSRPCPGWTSCLASHARCSRKSWPPTLRARKPNSAPRSQSKENPCASNN